MRLRDKLLQLYLFRVVPGSEAQVAADLSDRLRRSPDGDDWAFFSWLGRFDLLAASEVGEMGGLFGRDTFLFSPAPLPTVFDVAEIMACQLDLEEYPDAPSLAQLLSSDPAVHNLPDAPWVSLSLLKLDHGRLLHRDTVEAFKQNTYDWPKGAPDVLPYRWETQVRATWALHRLAARLSLDRDLGPFQLALGGGLGDNEIIAVCRFQRHASLFRFLEHSQALRVGDLAPRFDDSKAELVAPLFLSSFTQSGIDYRVVEPGFARNDYSAITFPGEDEPVVAVLQCAGPRGRTLPGVRSVFSPDRWSHAHALGETDDAFYSRGSVAAGDLLRKWVRLRREIGQSELATNRDRTELTLVQPAPEALPVAAVPRPHRTRLYTVDAEVARKFTTILKEAPQEVRAVEHILERCAALNENSEATVALADFCAYFDAVRGMMATAVATEATLSKLEGQIAEAARLGGTAAAAGETQLSGVRARLQELEAARDLLRDDRARDLRKLTDTVRLFDAALAQRVGAGTETLLAAGFSARAASHMGSLSRLILAGSYLAHAVYSHINRALASEAKPTVPYRGFILYSRDNEAWAFSMDISQLPDSVLWRPDDADILLHEIGHQLARSIPSEEPVLPPKATAQRCQTELPRLHPPTEFDAALRRAGAAAIDAGLLPGVRDSDYAIARMFLDLSNLWADLFWCGMWRSVSAHGVHEFIQDRLEWLARRGFRYTTADLGRAIGRLYAVSTCCGFLELSRRGPTQSLAGLCQACPEEAGLKALQESVQSWLENPQSQGPHGESWVRRGIRHFLGQPRTELRLRERYVHALLMAEAVRGSDSLLAVLGRGTGVAAGPQAVSPDDWREITSALADGRIPGAHVSFLQLRTIPQLVLRRLHADHVLDSLRARIALCVWLYDLYCREVLTSAWQGVPSASPHQYQQETQ